MNLSTMTLFNHLFLSFPLFRVSRAGDLLVNLCGDGVSVAKITRWPVSSVYDVQCSCVSLLTSGVEQLVLGPGAYVAYVKNMRLF